MDYLNRRNAWGPRFVLGVNREKSTFSRLRRHSREKRTAFVLQETSRELAGL